MREKQCLLSVMNQTFNQSKSIEAKQAIPSLFYHYRFVAIFSSITCIVQ